MKIANKKYFFTVLYILSGYPSVAVILLPRDFNPGWWNILVAISFISCVLFCALGNSYILRAQKESYIIELKLFNKTILFYNLASLLGVSMFIVLLVLEKNALSIANTLALLTTTILLFRIFRIEIIENPVKD